MTKLIAHRGLKKKGVKENSLEAFQYALENPNYVGFECDVRTTKDKHFIVCHNPMIKEDIISLTEYDALKKEHQLVDLEKVLKLQSDKIFLLEIKEPNLDVDVFLKLLEKYQEKKIYLMSFHNSVIKKLANRNCPFKLGVLNFVLNSEESYQDYDFICLLESIATTKLIKYFENKGIETFIYGIYHLDSLLNTYKNSYFITDKVMESS